MIIDTHQHFRAPEQRQKGPEDYKVLTSGEGITGVLCLTDAEFGLKLAAEEPLIVGVVARVGSHTPEFKAEIDEWAANPLFRGIRHTGREMEDIEEGSFLTNMEYLAEKDLVLGLLRICGGGEAVTKVFPNGNRTLTDYFGNARSFSGLEKLAERVPKLRIIVEHIAMCPIDGKPMNQTWQDKFKSNVFGSRCF